MFITFTQFIFLSILTLLMLIAVIYLSIFETFPWEKKRHDLYYLKEHELWHFSSLEDSAAAENSSDALHTNDELQQSQPTVDLTQSIHTAQNSTDTTIENKP